MELLIIILYTLSLVYIFFFSLAQLQLTWIYARGKKTKIEHSPAPPATPHVTIQLPIFNEKYVVERLLEAVSGIRYPKDKLEIQLLDDSTDTTTEILLKKMEAIRPLGLDIKLLHRQNRIGFKAGALDYGLKTAQGDYIVIFDADFIPQPDFLEKTLLYFSDARVGVVQTRWGHVNRDYSLLTQLQAFGLDAHFTIEQTARNRSGSFINFNGTCGIWRKQCIIDAGGWHFDTLTEDLDLSYRAQLRGWKFHYLEEVTTPGELPVIMPAIKSQQYRWNKGGAETARKVFGSVLRSDFSAMNKVRAFFHLFNSSVFVCLLLAAVLSVPVLYIKSAHPEQAWIFNLGLILLAGFFSIALFYWYSARSAYSNAWRKFIQLFPGFLIVSMGLSFHNALAVVEGLLGRRTPFVRTPKFNVTNRREPWRGNSYIRPRIGFITVIEGILCLYFVYGIVAGFILGDGGLMVFHLMLALGFGSVFYFSVKPAMNA
jgi:cellulose synthase/poly-beta-1,6-N-acetylglucosamine synthase-like glycosyltransferase